MKLEEKINEIIKPVKNEILTNVYTQLMGDPKDMDYKTMATLIQKSDMKSKWGFDCGLSYIKVNENEANVLLSDYEYGDTWRPNLIILSDVLDSCESLTQAARVQSTTVTRSIVKEVIDLINKKLHVPKGVNLFELYVWID